MAYTMLRPSARPACSVRSALPTPVVRAERTRTVVAVRGEADLATTPVLSGILSRVTAWRAGDVVIDLAEAEFIDTAAVRAMAVAQQLLDRQGRTLSSRSPSRLAARVLELSGLTDLIEARQRAQP